MVAGDNDHLTTRSVFSSIVDIHCSRKATVSFGHVSMLANWFLATGPSFIGAQPRFSSCANVHTDRFWSEPRPLFWWTLL